METFTIDLSMAQKKSRVSLIDVAKHADVSIATVSRVFNNNKAPVNPQTRERVLDVIKKLNYRPNTVAQSFRSHKTKMLGLIVSDVTHPHVTNLIAGAEKRIKQAGYVYTLANAANSEEGEKLAVELFLQNRVDGILSTGFTGERKNDIFRPLIEENVPFMFIGASYPSDMVPSVYVDNIMGGKLAAMHLTSMGHKRIMYMAGNHPDSDLRLSGYRQALKDAGIEENPDLIIYGGNTLADGFNNLRKFLKKKTTLPTAIFCFDDTVALGAMRALKEAGLQVPQDCSIVGFDNIVFGQYSSPSLTTVSQPAFQMGELGAKILLESLEGKGSRRHREVIFQPTLIVRESSAPPNTESVE